MIDRIPDALRSCRSRCLCFIHSDKSALGCTYGGGEVDYGSFGCSRTNEYQNTVFEGEGRYAVVAHMTGAVRQIEWYRRVAWRRQRPEAVPMPNGTHTPRRRTESHIAKLRHTGPAPRRDERKKKKKKRIPFWGTKATDRSTAVFVPWSTAAKLLITKTVAGRWSFRDPWQMKSGKVSAVSMTVLL